MFHLLLVVKVSDEVILMDLGLVNFTQRSE